MVDSPDEWPWSSWHCMLGNATSPSWLFSDALLLQFLGNRKDAIECYIEFVKNGVGKIIWDDLQHQVFLGDNDFVEKHQTMLAKLSGDLLEIPFKQRRITPLSLEQYSVQSKDKQAGQGFIKSRVSIDERPSIVDTRSRVGDWEIDLVIGKGHSGALVTIVERKTRFTV
jgi:hypothetical protein